MTKPPGRFLAAEWRSLLMVNYIVDPAVLKPMVPDGTELDLWNDRAYLSIVGFRFLKTRVLGVPIPFHRDFDEINLRFYVRRLADGQWRRGVVFVKEIVPRWAIAFVARTVYNENYVCHPMRSSVTLPGEVRYEWCCNGAWQALSARASGEAFVPAADSEETFITEHYWGYARQRDGGTVEYQVEHPPWRVWRCEQVSFHCDVCRTYGERFVPILGMEPASAFVADGSPVVVRKGRRLVT
jgi:hypothetical protein